MIKEDYVSYKVAKLLKEKGFDEICNYEWGVHDIDGDYELQKWEINNGQVKNSELIDGAYAAPTQQMAMKWLREVHNIYIEICIDRACNFNGITFRPAIYDKELDCLWESDNFSTYEKATEAAIKYSLENLI